MSRARHSSCSCAAVGNLALPLTACRFAFMSATSNRKVAVQYASNQGEDKQGLIMEIDQGMLDRGASLQCRAA